MNVTIPVEAMIFPSLKSFLRSPAAICVLTLNAWILNGWVGKRQSEKRVIHPYTANSLFNPRFPQNLLLNLHKRAVMLSLIRK